MNRQIQSLTNHVVVCGYGRLGRAVAAELELAGAPVVLIEQNPDLEPELAAAGHPYVLGCATEDGVLSAAGVENARAIVAATPSDADNVFIALSARELNPGISLHARAESDGGIRRLRLAGADQVVSLHGLGGQRIANWGKAIDRVLTKLEPLIEERESMVGSTESSIIRRPSNPRTRSWSTCPWASCQRTACAYRSSR